ncbi:anion permease, partial [Sutterella wadsworthensis]|uniref:anion permease n=1 Tax=Sutterella wadsworthensis TaxID=40545 RepID=UPI0024326E3A
MNPTLRNWLIILVVGAAIWFSPIPTGLKPDAWQIFAVFVTTVHGFILHPMP